MHPTTAAVDAVRTAVRTAMLAELGLATEWSWTAGLSGPDFLAAVRRQRVEQVLARVPGAFEVPPSVLEHLRSACSGSQRRSMIQSHELVRLAGLLSDEGIRFLSFKGPALSVQTTGDFSARGAGDLDVLIDPADVADAHRVLTGQGWQHVEPFPRPGASWDWRHLLDTTYELPLAGVHSRVDLHWRLDPTRRALPDFATAWERRETVALGGVQVPTLSLVDAFQHTCSHAAKDDWRWLRSLVDVHRMARRPEIWGDVTLRRVDLLTLAATHASVGLPPHVPSAVRGQLVPRSRVAVRALRAQGQPFPREWAPGLGLPNALRRLSRGSHSPGDLARLLYGIAIPAGHGSPTDPRTITALPTAAWSRGRYAVGRLRSWRHDPRR